MSNKIALLWHCLTNLRTVMLITDTKDRPVAGYIVPGAASGTRDRLVLTWLEQPTELADNKSCDSCNFLASELLLSFLFFDPAAFKLCFKV